MHARLADQARVAVRSLFENDNVAGDTFEGLGRARRAGLSAAVPQPHG